MVTQSEILAYETPSYLHVNFRSKWALTGVALYMNLGW